MRPGIAALPAIIAAAIALPAAPARADDDKPELQKMRFVERGDDLTVSTLPPPTGGIGKLFDASNYEALGTGIESTVVIRIRITPQDSDDPVAEQLIRRSVVYDVWDEVYRLQLDERGSQKKFQVKYRAEALKWLTAIEDLPVAHLALKRAGRSQSLHLVEVLLAAERRPRLRQELLRLPVAGRPRREPAQRHRE